MSNIIARFGFREPVPGRLYLSDSGLEKVFGISDPIKAARQYAAEIISNANRCRLIGECKYLLGIIRGDKNYRTKIIDLFLFAGVDDWSGNPEVYTWAFKNRFCSQIEFRYVEMI